MRSLPGFLIVAAAHLALTPPPAMGQRSRGPEASLLIGPGPYDLGRTGTGLVLAAGVTFRPRGPVLSVEPGLGILFLKNEFDVRTNWFFPEISIQAQARLGWLRPYLGAGAGGGVQSRPGSDRWVGTLHGVGGVRLRLGQGWGARSELRLREVSSSGRMADILIGVIRGMP